MCPKDYGNQRLGSRKTFPSGDNPLRVSKISRKICPGGSPVERHGENRGQQRVIARSCWKFLDIPRDWIEDASQPRSDSTGSVRSHLEEELSLSWFRSRYVVCATSYCERPSNTFAPPCFKILLSPLFRDPHSPFCHAMPIRLIGIVTSQPRRWCPVGCSAGLWLALLAILDRFRRRLSFRRQTNAPAPTPVGRTVTWGTNDP